MTFIDLPYSQLREQFFDNDSHEHGDMSYSSAMFIDQFSLSFVKFEHLRLRVNSRGVRLMGIRSFYIMAKKSYGIEWVTLRLGKSDKKAFDAWMDENLDDLDTLEQTLLESGYKVARSFDMTADCFIVTVTGKADTPLNGGKGYTSRSDSLIEAVGMALYKHWGLANGGDWSKLDMGNDSWG